MNTIRVYPRFPGNGKFSLIWEQTIGMPTLIRVESFCDRRAFFDRITALQTSGTVMDFSRAILNDTGEIEKFLEEIQK